MTMLKGCGCIATFAVVIMTLVSISAVAEEASKKPLAVAGYIPEYRYGGIDWKGMSKRVTHAILFSLEVSREGKIVALDRFPDAKTYALAREETKRAGAKLMICLGGNSRTNGFPVVATNPKLRSTFVQNMKDFLVQHDLDGVDLNWEYPQGRAQWQGLWLIIDELYEVLHPLGKVITMAVYPSQEPLLPSETLKKLDLVLDMAYDNVCARGERPPCKHSTYEFATRVINDAEKHGFPLEKLALGVPFYARDVNNGVPETYAELVKQFNIDDSPSIDRIGNWYYNGPKTIAKKVRLAHDRGLGGIMIWELGQDVLPDAPGSLLAALDDEVKKISAESSEAQKESEVPKKEL